MKPHILSAWKIASDTIRKHLPKVSRQQVVRGAAAMVVAAATAASVKMIGANKFGLQETVGIVTSDILQPGVRLQFPFAQITHVYHTNTQKFELNAGSGRFLPFWSSTSDQNILTTDVVLSYQIQPNAQKLSFWRWSMEDWFAPTDGYWVITGMMNDSANAVLGKRTMAETLANPSRYSKELFDDLQQRLDRSNVPVSIESVELREINTTIFPTRTISYNRTVSKTSEHLPPPK